MNNRIARSKSTLFLIELILAIGIFAVASAICIQLFVRAHLLSKESEAITHSLYAATSAAEVFKATNGQPGPMAELLSASDENGQLVVYYNSTWEIVPSPVPGGFVMRIGFDFTSQPAEALIRVNDAGGSEVYSLMAKKYISGEVAS